MSLEAMTLKLKGLLARLREAPNRNHLIWALVIFALALTLRSLWVAFIHADPFDGRHMNDGQSYHASAVALLHGKGYISPWTGAATAQWPPGYSILLAGLYAIFGEHVSVAWDANIVLSALTCVVLYFVGNLVGGKKVGILAGLLLAVFPGHIFFSSLVLSETLFTFLVVVIMALVLLAVRKSDDEPVQINFAGVLVALVRGQLLTFVVRLISLLRQLVSLMRAAGPRRIILTGVLVAAAAMVRGQGLFLIFVAGLFWWLCTRDWERALQRATVVGLIAIVLIIPWSIRNYVAMHTFVFLSTNDGENLYIGNSEFANGRFQFGVGMWILNQFSDLPPNEQEAMASNAMMREGLRFMFTHPGKELQLTGSKIRALYEDDEDGLRWIEAPEVGKPIGNRSLWKNIANVYYFSVLALAGVGLVPWWRQRRGALLLPLLLIGVFTLGQMLFFATSRFHVPMLPSFCLLAAAGIVAGVEYVRSRPRGPKPKAVPPSRKARRGKSKRRR
jgi:4-amino-4-deoxy-L-arabinose transferase-like glycosyltransferase